MDAVGAVCFKEGVRPQPRPAMPLPTIRAAVLTLALVALAAAPAAAPSDWRQRIWPAACNSPVTTACCNRQCRIFPFSVR